MCAIVGVFDNDESSKIAYYALFAMQHRGQEASGISTIGEHGINTIKNTGLVTKVFDENKLEFLKGKSSIGHNRYSTAGQRSLKDAQPIAITCNVGDIAIAHNGNFVDKDEVRDKLIQNGAIFQSSMDTENIIHLIATNKAKDIQTRIIESLRCIKGAYCLVILTKDKMFAIRDPYGVRPLSLASLPHGGFMVASETCAFDLVGAKFIRDINPGEMLVFQKNEEPKSYQLFKPDPHICAFEYIYFARPDSIIEGLSVYESRKKLGEALAKEHKVNADLVIPVPDSGVGAALGYAKQSGLPFEIGIVRNHYVGRTFIEPTQSLRDLKVKLKLNPQTHIINNKRLVVIDDSIVRGTTSRQIVRMLKLAGAKEVHMRIAAPEIRYPDKYGIDTPNKSELISSKMTKEEICEYIGADSLEFLSLEALKESLGKDRNYSLASFDGNYFIK